jgi:hypothetical protein
LSAAGGENDSVRLRPAVRGLSVFAALLGAGATAACTADTPPVTTPVPTASDAPDPGDAARTALAARAALAQDHTFAALYKFTPGDGPARNVVATVTADGNWRVDIAGGVLGGTTDVAVVSLPNGVYQCGLTSPTNPITSTCVLAAKPGKRLPKDADPKVERVFRQWLGVFTDRQAALSVNPAQRLPGATGDCWSVDSIQASLAAPVDVGIYCYAADGLLTAARVDFGTITLASTPVAAPAKINLPGPITGGPLLGLTAPPPPSPTPSSVASAPPAP